MLDKYIIGGVGRISPEAPVPIIKVKKQKNALGGAANVANNVISLGGKTSLIGLIGDDQDGAKTRQILEEKGVSPYLFQFLPYTITKTRVIGERQQIARIDSEPDGFICTKEQNATVLAQLQNLLQTASCVVISDYAKGFLTTELIKDIISLSAKYGVPSIVDPKGNDWTKYRNASIITPNLKELGEATNGELKNIDEEVVKAAMRVIEEHNIETILTTRSEKGISHISKKHVCHAPTQTQEVYDVSGAGDTVVSTIALTINSKLAIEERLYLANVTAGIVVGKIGTATVSTEELFEALSQKGNTPEKHLISVSELIKTIEKERANGKRIVFTNGCFDILHRGHITYLEKAKQLGEVLVVGLNSDASVSKIKGPSRPINNEEDRAFMLSKLGSVDHLVIVDEDTPAKLIEQVKPHFLVKGGDYTVEKVVGREHAGEVVLIDFVDGYSTSSVIEKSKK